jgi:Protein involved in vacuole import and degradation
MFEKVSAQFVHQTVTQSTTFRFFVVRLVRTLLHSNNKPAYRNKPSVESQKYVSIELYDYYVSQFFFCKTLKSYAYSTILAETNTGDARLFLHLLHSKRPIFHYCQPMYINRRLLLTLDVWDLT